MKLRQNICKDRKTEGTQQMELSTQWLCYASSIKSKPFKNMRMELNKNGIFINDLKRHTQIIQFTQEMYGHF